MLELAAGVHPSVAWTLATIAVLVFLAGFIKAVIMPALKAIRQISRFLDDWYGRENDPHRPGIRSRLEDVETQVKQVHHQTHVNGGGSLKDAVNRIEAKVDEAGLRVTGLTHRLDLHFLEANARDRTLKEQSERLTAIEHDKQRQQDDRLAALEHDQEDHS